ncbi:cytochrome c oxidase-assembly factor COX23, mitochondrial [Cryptococcus gattii Ru294]|uniref:Aerobic respiration-related protein, putative n=4 Tax=Cryptococcus gattii species complex TaxID=1884637 RepID=E6RG42_CRYGW|nr:Aerobic respiration-related protein, putative [Cryptococcus gattii WM276]KIR44759.1 cytochrome c oxidase-assembly factor COX23, mitochondrial [Cryptococcus bacillisporus CA1280]KIR53062.1 cytochrome c oxidase-assembly factor COX23, mitochondrial [Cryptococcus gattii Ru294]KIR58497.1 cytochrome c oxidase-assembly factor COX23, mitochondrial [Cryptococcus bacillisporus CA1873]KIR78039.1 cytochrome c oxidase-assembly factor COX23, mitochondrial [Cryptococcus gattii EJB2]KIR84292.1 cytochrome c|eukprot:KIR58497.1 cytochrome c oxidase-assembly factor COX23, mitochondrial [Cryptococcus gattii CA1873]
MATQVPPSTNPTPFANRPAPPTKDLEIPEDYKKTFRFVDPCEAARKASLDCLERAHYNRSECMDFFTAYKECKGNWLAQRKEDRMKGRDTV